MNRSKTTRCPYPLVLCDASGVITYKNKPFDRVFRTRLSESVRLFLPGMTCERLLLLRAFGRCEFFPLSSDGVCGFFGFPTEDGLALVFLPEYLRALFDRTDAGRYDGLVRELAKAECSEYKADAVARIHACVYKNLSMSPGFFSDPVNLSSLVGAAAEKITACASPLGIRVRGKAAPSFGSASGSLAHVLVAELLLLFETAYASSADGTLEFFAEEDFGGYFFGYASTRESDEPSPLILADEYFLKSITAKNGHTFTVRDDGARTVRAVSVRTLPPDVLKSASNVAKLLSAIVGAIDF